MKILNSNLLMVALGLTLMSGASVAGPFQGMHPLQSDRFGVGLGAFVAEISGHYNFDDGSDIDTDETGLDSTDTLPAMALVWRVSNRLRLQGEYFQISNRGKQTLNESIFFPSLDTEFDVGARIESELTVGIARVFVGYSFIKNERMELGGGLGLHYMNIDAALSGTATIDGIPVIDAEVGDDLGAILPNIGGYANYALSSKWLLGARVDWISANIGDYEGGLWNVEGAIQYQLFDHFGVGASYRYLAMDLTVDDGKSSWGIDLAYEGPMLFVTGSF